MESQGKIELPRAFEHADIDHLVVLIADMLDRLIEHNDKIPLSPEALTRFHSRTPPTISVLDYLRRIVKYANVERTCLLITLHYIDQICARLPHFTLSSLTCHRFIITAIVVASKALCDAFCTNAHYAKVGGIRVGELNVLEKELLNAIDWRLTSTREVLDAYYVNLIRTHSNGAYTLAAEATSPALTDVDSDMESLLSATPSPTFVPATLEDEKSIAIAQGQPMMVNGVLSAANGIQGGRSLVEPQAIEPSTVLIDRATLSPRPSTGPTLEQNMAFEALRQQTLISPTSSTSKKACSSDPIAAAASTTDPMVVSSPCSPSVVAAAAASGRHVPGQNGSSTNLHPPRSPLSYSNSQSPSHLHKSYSNSATQSSNSSSTLSDLLSGPPSASVSVSTSPRTSKGMVLRSPIKRSVAATYQHDSNTNSYAHANMIPPKSEIESSVPTNDIEGGVDEGAMSNTRSPMNGNDNQRGNTYVDIDVDVPVDDIDCMRPRTRMRIEL